MASQSKTKPDYISSAIIRKQAMKKIKGKEKLIGAGSTAS